MPPHCDTLDGPVVQAAKNALETGNVNIILPWVYADGEQQLRNVFTQVLEVKKLKEPVATQVAERWLFETAVRIHREGEGAPLTRLKPTGLEFGPILQKDDKSIEPGNPNEVIHTLQHAVQHEIKEKFKNIQHSKNYDLNDVTAARKYVNAYLTYALYSHHLYEKIGEDVHAAEVEAAAVIKDGTKPQSGHHHH